MGRACILTDSTAQFTRPDFPGHEHVCIVPFSISGDGGRRLQAPDVEEFTAQYRSLGREYDQIVAVLLSSALSPAAGNARRAADANGWRARVQVIDSQTTAVGLGLLVERAAAAALKGDMLAVERKVRETMPAVYSLFCLPGLRTLALSGYLSESQALVGEMLGLLPIFAMEEGQLSPFNKVRTQRHLIETFEEYLGEFADPAHIALIRSNGNGRGNPLREYVETAFPDVAFSEHVPNAHLSALFGPNSAGLVVLEGPNGRNA